LRTIALAGTGVVFVQELVSAFPLKARQEAGFLLLVVAVLAVGLVLRFGLPQATARLLRHPDLLVPLGLLIVAEAILGWLLLLPPVAAILTPPQPLKLGVLSFSISAASLVSILLWVAYAAWVTTLILDEVRHDRANPVEALNGLRCWFFRVWGLECIGWGVLFLGLACAVALGPGALPLAVVGIVVGSVLWNLATAALLPVALDARLSFGEALRHGIQVSWRAKGRWWRSILAQMMLLGLFTFVSVSYAGHSKTNWSANGFWTGGYENECRWYGKLMEALEVPKVAVISTALGFVFGVLAIAVKLRIVEDLEPPVTEAAGSPPLPDDDFQERSTIRYAERNQP
jgi:hypothetical protein